MKTFKLKTLLLAVLCTFGISQAWAISGTGRIGDPYLISNASDLDAFATNVSKSTSPGGTGNTHYRTVYGKLMADMTASSSTLALTKACVLDFNGHTLTTGYAIYTQNKTDAIVLMNGTLKGVLDGNGGDTDAYPYGTVALYNMTVGDIWTDGHHYYILGTTTGTVRNAASTDGQGGTSYTGTVYTDSDISSTSYDISNLDEFKAFAFRVDGSSTELTGKLTADVTIPDFATGTGGDGSSVFLRKPCTVDLNGHTIKNTLYMHNESGTIYLKNGTVDGLDGEGWGDDAFPNGTVDLTDMTTNTIYVDGHKFDIHSGKYGTIYNSTNTDYGTGSYTGTVTLYGGYYQNNPTTQTGVSVATGYTLNSSGSTVSGYPYYVTPKTCTVTYDPNGGTVGTVSTLTLTYGKTWSCLATGDCRPTRSGQTFAGWYDQAVGGVQVYDANGCAVECKYWTDAHSTYESSGLELYNWIYSESSTLTLYAHWYVNINNVSTSFAISDLALSPSTLSDNNGGPNVGNFYSGDYFNVNANILHKGDYKLTFNSSLETSGSTGKISLYVGAPEGSTAADGAKPTASSPAYETVNKTDSWSTYSNSHSVALTGIGEGEMYVKVAWAAGNGSNPSACGNFKNFVLTKTKGYISFNLNGGTCTESTDERMQTIGQAYGELPTPTKAGFTFAGWYNGTTKVTSTSVFNQVDNPTLVAHWNDDINDSNLLPGRFSVSATKQVYFAKSNLYWDGSNYKFEDKQTDGPSTTWNASHVSYLTWENVTDYKAGYKPYTAQFDHGTLSDNDKCWCGEENPLTVEGTSGLYVLTGYTDGEWNYLLNGRPNASNLYKYGVTVGGVQYCVVIAPDDFPGTLASSYTLEEANSLSLVVLPPNGYKDSRTTPNPTIYGLDTNHEGFYMTATPRAKNDVGYGQYVVKTYPGQNAQLDNPWDYRWLGAAVRLVKNLDVINTSNGSFTIENWDKAPANTIGYVDDTNSTVEKTNVFVKQDDDNYEAPKLVITDGKAFTLPEALSGKTCKAAEATYTRNTSSNWGTICLPYAVKGDDYVQYYQLNAVYAAQGIMSFKAVESVEANTPAVFCKKDASATSITAATEDETIVKVSANPSSSTETASAWTLKGTYANTELDQADNIYYIAQNQFWCANQIEEGKKLSIPAYRAYFEGPKSGTFAKAFSIAIFDGDDATAIGTIDANGEVQISDGKFINNGKVVIVKNGKKYNTAGAMLK